MKIGTILDHATALAAYQAAGFSFPEIPPGMNTVWHHFDDQDGTPCIIVNQRGHIPTAEDNEEQVNGCSLLVAVDAPDPDTARATLERAVHTLLELES